jgi:predicted nucleotidyltransferase
MTGRQCVHPQATSLPGCWRYRAIELVYPPPVNLLTTLSVSYIITSVKQQAKGSIMGTYELLQQKRNEILSIASKYGAHNIRIFGSVARGEADEKSDIDFLVDLQPGSSLLDLGGLWAELNELFSGRADVATENGLRDRIRDRVLEEAVPL